MSKLCLLLLFCIGTLEARNQPGRLDSTFGNNGIQTTAFIGNVNLLNEEGRVVMTSANGDIFVVVQANGFTRIVKYLPDGKLDSSYGNAGCSNAVKLGSTSAATQGDKILVAGTAGNYPNYDFALARYTAGGALDSSFGENGKVTTDFDRSSDVVHSIALQGDKILVVGYSSNDIALVRYTANGALDSCFGEHGRVATELGVNAIALQGDKILVAGFTNHPDDYDTDFALARYTGDGRLDPSFGENGRVTTDLGSYEEATSIALQGNKIILAGNTGRIFDGDFALVRYTSDGMLDASFGVNGKVTTDLGSNDDDRAYSIALQGNRIIVGGYNGYIYDQSNFALVSYTVNGALDSSFGENGKVTTDFKAFEDQAYSIALQGGKIIAAGSAYDSVSGNKDFALARYTAEGRLDPSFGKKGLLTGYFPISETFCTSTAIQGSKIIAAGYALNDNNNYDFTLARHIADGALDYSFGVNGKVTTDFNKSSDDYATSIALQEGKIIVAGYTYNSVTHNDDFALARYTAKGVLDSSFGENGKVITDFKNSNDAATSIAVQGDKIIVAGSTGDWSNYDFALARYTAEGRSDASFGVNGKVITDLGGSATIEAIALLENRLYAVGSLDSITGDIYGIVAAYKLEAPEPSINIVDVTVHESKKLAVLTVKLSAPATRWVQVHYTTRNKTAVHPDDYRSTSGTLLFAPSFNTTVKVFIPIVDDSQKENDEQFDILLKDALHASIQDSVAVVTILDNDDALITKQSASLRIQVSPNPSAGAFTVQLQGSNYRQRVSVRVYEMSGRLIEQRENIGIGQSLRLGEQYKTGTYLIEAVQGSQSVQTKVIKSGK